MNCILSIKLCSGCSYGCFGSLILIIINFIVGILSIIFKIHFNRSWFGIYFCGILSIIFKIHFNRSWFGIYFCGILSIIFKIHFNRSRFNFYFSIYCWNGFISRGDKRKVIILSCRTCLCYIWNLSISFTELGIYNWGTRNLIFLEINLGRSIRESEILGLCRSSILCS